jgi:thiol:disulfide interchange protein
LPAPQYSTFRRSLVVCALLLTQVLALLPAPGQAQTSAMEAVTHSNGSPATLTPAAASAVLGAVHDCSHQPFSAEQAFQVTATAAGSENVRIDWKIAAGCYLYRNRMKVKAQTPGQVGALALPEGENHHDEYFGTQQIYHNGLSATLPVSRAAGAGEQMVAFDVTYQGCAEVGLCYPPITKTLAVTLPPPLAAASATTSATAPITATDQPKFLTAGPGLPGLRERRRPRQRARLDWQIADGVLPVPQPYPGQNREPGAARRTLALPEGKSQTDEYFGTQQIYEHTLSATLPLARSGGHGAA